MAASERSLRITDAYRRQLLRRREETVRIVGDRYLADPEDLEAFFAAAVLMIAGGQRDAVNLTNTYAVAYVSSELEELVDLSLADPNDHVGHTRDGRSLAKLLLPVAFAVRLARARRRPAAEITGAGFTRAIRVARTEVMDASRQAMQTIGRKNSSLVGWRRVTASAPCGACLGEATGVVERSTAAMRIHPSCSCTAEPVVEKVTERAVRPTGDEMFSAMSYEEQNALFAGTGGAAKADLLRAGVPIQELVTLRTYIGLRDVITETPLKALAS